VFSDDITKFLLGVGTEEDLRLAGHLIRTCCSISGRVSIAEALDSYFETFFKLCIHLGNTEEARLVWNDPKFQEKLSPEKKLQLQQLYLVLLYRTEQYSEIVDEVSLIPEHLEAGQQYHNASTIAVAALAQDPTPESLLKAQALLAKQKSDLPFPKSQLLFAWMNYSLGNLAATYDFLSLRELAAESDKRRVTKKLITFKLTILADMGRVEDAFDLIRTKVLDPPGSTYVNFEVMEKLNEAVRAQNDPKLRAQLTKLLSDMESKPVDLFPLTFKDDVFSYIKDNRAKKSRSRRSKDPRQSDTIDSQDLG